jgi:hypothetical protein
LQAQEEALKAWIAAILPRSTRQVDAYIEQEFGVVYESRAGLVALLHRLGLEYHKPEVIGRKLDAKKQQAFIAAYNDLLSRLARTKRRGSWTPCIRRTARGPSDAGRRPRKTSQSNKPADASASTFTARLTLKPAKPR